ncbi:MAG TPA: helicase-related protein [Erysipelotrichaceae bacterium]|mgnify:CR=1 FL=1|nr:helicase-related protein [Erysipelotrichaceae bacterium]HQA84703.1 helicase-related protein [Erysipelotrichaceae bacterium]
MNKSFIYPSDLSIFTNKNENGIKLSDRLNSVLTNSKYFDVLSGYFRITGFYLLSQKLETVEEIRILIGLGTDEKTIKAVNIFEISGSNAVFKIKEIVKEEFSLTTDDSVEMENGVIKFCEWISSGKLKVRLCYDQNVHAKVYIIRKDPDIVPDQFGNVITGSSNFTYGGLEKNVEFNVELKDQYNVQYALDFFNELWKNSKDITSDIEETIKNETWMSKNITPYELYLKTLAVYFEEEISTRKENYEWPEGYMNLQYQEDAVTQARKILAKHGGVLISDVVGLGKTYISAMLGKLLQGRKLFIVPPVVKDNWEHVLSDFGYKMSDKVVSLGIIDQVAEWEDLGSYKYIFIDEAHRFRNASSTEFQYLKKICYGKGVILITATPQNNTILDIANLITLFQDSRNSSIIPGCKDLDKYFSELHRQLKKSDNDPITVSSVASDIRDKVLRNVLIRRTRNEIATYYAEDLKKQELKFPKVNDPIRLEYMYNEEMDKVFDDTIALLKKFTYARYTPLLYLKDKKRIGSDKARQENMRGFVKTMLVKRLESSIYAFIESIKRLKESSEGFIKLFEKGKVVVGSVSRSKFDYADLEEMENDYFQLMIDAYDIDCYELRDFEEKFFYDVKSDDNLLNDIYNIWKKFDIKKQDSKYDVLKKKIDSIEENKKIIIFSEAKDTVDYLKERLTSDYENVIIDFSGGDSLGKKKYIQNNFDPNFAWKNINDKRILITTDALSEGVNLHNASIIINYDLPWNPTRIMQRVGRINRVGSKNKELYVYNFFPRDNTKEHLSLEDSIKSKIQMFNELLGGDLKYITDDEKVESYNLYNFLMMANKLPDEIELSTNALQMSYIQIINKIIEDEPNFFEKIQNLPNKIRLARKHSDETKAITFIKQGLIKKFIKYEYGKSSEIEFEEAIRMLEASKDEKSIVLPKNYFSILNANKKTFVDIINTSKLQNIGSTSSPNEKKIRKYLKALLASQDIKLSDKEYLEKVDASIKRGSLNSRIFKDLIKEISKNNQSIDAIIKSFKSIIDEIYLEERKNYDVMNSLNNQKIIVLTECLIKEN